ncbi:MAG: transcriptional regulator GcvA [Gammaproteobacteria bacterium]
MRRRLPPLNALRVFEAAGRHLSFTKAAAELHVTQAAVSHQIKALEEHLGLALFRRLNRALVLTADGQTYLRAVRQAFEDLWVATERLRRSESSGVLTVSTLASFAARWLVPRLGRFREAHPEIDIRIAPSHELVDFARTDVDVAVRYGGGRYPGLRADRFMTEDVFPVCSPALLQGQHPLRQPEDLQYHHLLHDDHPSGWLIWLEAAGIHKLDASRGSVFNDSSMLIQAAVAGQGVALARSVLAADELAAGRLVRPFELSLPAALAYYIVCPEETAGQPKIIAFREWLFHERDNALAQAPALTGVAQPSRQA